MNPNRVGLARRLTVAAVMYREPKTTSNISYVLNKHVFLCSEQTHDTPCALNTYMILWRAGRLEKAYFFSFAISLQPRVE